MVAATGEVRGVQFVAGTETRGTEGAFHAVDPATVRHLSPSIPGAGDAQLADACTGAAVAARDLAHAPPEARAMLLERIAERMQSSAERIVARGAAETGLGTERLTGELARTTGQLRLFAAVLRDGAFLDVHLQRAEPSRTPAPRPDLRRTRVSIGPVAVFGAGNFPLAFSVAGGDTASALAAGSPVIVKGHPSHPGTSELVARSVTAAVADCALPGGTFSLLQGTGHALGTALVRHPAIRAVAFTGSRAGGLALVKAAAWRPVPIPVYAEMSSINPVVLLSGALATRGADIARDFVASLTLGAGQFCTNPGLLIGVDGPALNAFLETAAAAISRASGATMLTPGTASAYGRGVHRLDATSGVTRIAAARPDHGTPGTAEGPRAEGGATGHPVLFATAGARFLEDRSLQAEVFGPAALMVRCDSNAELVRVIESLEGQLTATLQLEPRDHDFARTLLPVLRERAGRIVCNDFPTGVEVGAAMVHGGPFPATSDGRSTSVGSAAIERFLRSVCFQDLPDALLPPELQRANPVGVPRREDAPG